MTPVAADTVAQLIGLVAAAVSVMHTVPHSVLAVVSAAVIVPAAVVCAAVVDVAHKVSSARVRRTRIGRSYGTSARMGCAGVRARHNLVISNCGNSRVDIDFGLYGFARTKVQMVSAYRTRNSRRCYSSQRRD